jgi:CheY-like chemotaxis protein
VGEVRPFDLASPPISFALPWGIVFDMTEVNLTGRRVLVVEDEMAIAMMIEDMLADAGCEVAGMASRPAEALSAIAGDLAIDAAILDVNLGGSDSYEVAAALKARGVPFVFSTGYGRSGLPDDMVDNPVLQKPFRQQDLVEALEGLLAVGRAPGA